MKPIVFWILTLLLLVYFPADSQKKRSGNGAETLSFDPELYKAMEWRCIGPFRGGRSAAVTGVKGNRNLFYFGSTGGGVWKTMNGGESWENISDGFFGGSIGAVSVSESDPNVIYVGGGEKTLRGNVSFGYGIWKSEDAGKTWKFSGLEQSRHISRIRIHPENHNLVFAAVIGDIYQPGETRGIYRSKDGGNTWERILFANIHAGAVDLALDPSNPRILYASTWRVRRTPYSFESGGDGSGIWKSTDGGDTWKNLSTNEGLPMGPLGIIGIAVSPVDPERVFAIVEAVDGGVFRSDDAGHTWVKTNGDRALRQRAWYYSRIYADTEDEDVVYVMNVSYHRSKDGGKTFEAFNAPHGDHHDLWIDTADNRRMIIADDGGAQVSFDGGENWSTYHNQPTGQFYRVTADNHFPYRIYGAQQDNSTIRILHRTEGSAIRERDWEETAGGESAHIAVDPDDPEIVYGGSYGGFLQRYDHRSGQSRLINVWPDNPMGHGAEGMKYRFQWNFPIFFSPHNPDKLYACSNYLHVTYNGGQSWETISPDLTTNSAEKLGPSGGPITKDNTGVEYYCTIFAAAESQHEQGVIWTGSDDGLIYLTKDGGKNWQEVTPAGMPAWTMINSIEVDPFNPGGLYVAATSYKSGDYRPYLFRTTDFGASWQKITAGIREDHFTRVLRADPDRKGLLYCGTESGMYLSFDDGKSWHTWQLNLPVVPVTDLLVRDKNLIASTQGRGFWIIDDLSPLHQLVKNMEQKTMVLFEPAPAYRIGGSQDKKNTREGTNHPGGVLVHYYLAQEPDSSLNIRLKFLEPDGRLIKTFSNRDEEKKLQAKKGLNRFAWDMRYPDARKFDGMILWFSSLRGPVALPGKYKVRLIMNNDSLETDFHIVRDPRSDAHDKALADQFEFLRDVNTKLSETHEAIITIRDIRKQVNQVKERTGKNAEYERVSALADSLNGKLTAVEEKLYQTKNRSEQDPLNYPVRLNNKLAHLMWLCSVGDYQPTTQALAFRDEVVGEIDINLAELKRIIRDELPAFNRAVTASGILPVMVE